MKRIFTRNFLFIVLLNLLVKPFFVLVLEVKVQNEVGLETYGDYFSLFNLALILNILLDFGINNRTLKWVGSSPQIASKYYLNLLSIKGVLFLVYTILAYGVCSLLQMSIPNWEGLFALILVNQFLISLIQLNRAHLGGLHLFKTDAFTSVLDKLLMTGLLAYLVYQPGDVTILAYVLTMTIAYFLTVVLSSIAVFRNIQFSGGYANFIKKSRVLVSDSLPYALLVFLMYAYTRTDAIMLNSLVEDESQAGIYAQAYRLLDAINIVPLLGANILLPIFARLHKDKKELRSVVRIGGRWFYLMSLPVVVFVFFYSQEISALLYEHGVASTHKVLQMLIITFLPVALGYVFGTFLTAVNHIRTYNYIASAGLVLNIGLNLWLIPMKGAYGAAVATLVTQAIVSVLQMIIVQKEVKFFYPSLQSLLFLVFTSVAVILAYFLKKVEFDLAAGIGIYAVAMLALSLLTNLLKKDDLLWVQKA